MTVFERAGGEEWFERNRRPVFDVEMHFLRRDEDLLNSRSGITREDVLNHSQLQNARQYQKNSIDDILKQKPSRSLPLSSSSNAVDLSRQSMNKSLWQQDLSVFLWLKANDSLSAQNISATMEKGEMSSDLPDHVAHDIRPFHIPKLPTFEYIHKLIPDATHISSYPTQLVAELESTSPEIFKEKLKYLPSGIGSISIGYVNGKLLPRPP